MSILLSMDDEHAVDYLPISVKNSKTTTAGPINGNISEKVDANTTRRFVSGS